MKRIIVVSLAVFAVWTESTSACPRLFRLRAPRATQCAPPQRMPYVDEPVKLRLKFEKGKDFYVEMETQTKQKMTVMGQEVLQEQDQLFVQHWQPIRMTPDGDWLIHVRFVRVRMKMDIGGNRIEYDSWNETPSSPLADYFEALTKVDFKATVRLDGGVRNVDGIEDFLKVTSDANPQMQALLKAMINKESFGQMISPLGNYLPESAVSRGDGWARKTTLNLGPIGQYVTSFKYSHRGAVGSLHEIRVKTSLSYTPPENEAGLPFIIKSADLKSKDGEGKIFFDADKGRMKEMSMRMQLAGKLVIQIGDQESAVILEQTQTSRLRTLDTYPRPKAKRQTALLRVGSRER
jgi:Family of unknown function (DUF6263)